MIPARIDVGKLLRQHTVAFLAEWAPENCCFSAKHWVTGQFLTLHRLACN